MPQRTFLRLGAVLCYVAAFISLHEPWYWRLWVLVLAGLAALCLVLSLDE